MILDESVCPLPSWFVDPLGKRPLTSLSTSFTSRRTLLGESLDLSVLFFQGSSNTLGSNLSVHFFQGSSIPLGSDPLMEELVHFLGSGSKFPTTGSMLPELHRPEDLKETNESVMRPQAFRQTDRRPYKQKKVSCISKD